MFLKAAITANNCVAVMPGGLTQVPGEGARHRLGGGSCSGEISHTGLRTTATDTLGKKKYLGEIENFVERAREFHIVPKECNLYQDSKV